MELSCTLWGKPSNLWQMLKDCYAFQINRFWNKVGIFTASTEFQKTISASRLRIPKRSKGFSSLGNMSHRLFWLLKCKFIQKLWIRQVCKYLIFIRNFPHNWRHLNTLIYRNKQLTICEYKVSYKMSKLPLLLHQSLLLTGAFQRMAQAVSPL